MDRAEPYRALRSFTKPGPCVRKRDPFQVSASRPGRLQVEKNGNATKVITLAFLASLASVKALSSYINACAKSNTLGSHMARNMFAQSTCRHSTVAMKWVPQHQACSHLAFSRERLRSVLRKKAAVVIHLQIYILTPSHLQI